MEDNFRNHSEHDSDVSCFTLDGVVAEMVIEVDEENESPQKAIKLSEFGKFKDSNLENVCSNVFPGANLDYEAKDTISSSKESGHDDEFLTEENATSEPQSIAMKEKISLVTKKIEQSSVRDSSLAKSDYISNESMKDSIFSDLDLIRKSAKLTGSHDEIMKVAKLIEGSREESVDSADSEKSGTISTPISLRKRKTKPTKNLIKDAAKLLESKEKIMEVAKLIEESKEKVVDSSDSEKAKTISTPKSIRKRKTKPSKQVKGVLNDSKDFSESDNESQLPVENESLGNVMPTAISTRGNKRKVVDIEQESGAQKPSLKSSEVMVSEKKKIEISISKQKPKLFDLFANGASLERFIHFKTSLIEADLKCQRHFYRVLFDKWAPKEKDKMIKEILQFSGFSFKRNSEEVEKRRHVLQKLPDEVVVKICKMLDLKEGKKDNMVANILKFLMKPSKMIKSVVDPFHISMQPYVKLEKLSFGNKYLTHSREKPDVGKLGLEKPHLEKPISPLKSKSGRVLKPKSMGPDVEVPKAKKKEPVSKNDAPANATKKKSADKVESPIATPQKMTLSKTKSSISLLKQKNVANIGPLSAPKRKLSASKVGTPVTPKKKTPVPEIVSSMPTEVELPDNYDMDVSEIVSTGITESPVKEDEISIVPENRVDGKEKNLQPQDISKEDTTVNTSVTKKQVKSTEPKGAKPSSKKLVKSTAGKKNPKLSVVLHKKAMKDKIKTLKKEIVKLRKKVSEAVVKPKGTIENGAIIPTLEKPSMRKELEDYEPIGFPPIAPVLLATKEEKKSEDDSNEVSFSADGIDTTISADDLDTTLSADETVDEDTNDPAKKKKLIRCGKPLRLFKNIRDSIANGSFSALQRLHILLFGASDKAENLKANILAFGGFPFLDGSDQWKQKEFLLSLLALNTLKEYLNLLCIEYSEEDDQQKLISKLMKFLAAPSDVKEKSPERKGSLDLRTEVVQSELVQPLISTQKNTGKKKKSKKDEKPKSTKVRHRKVLMDEDQVRRLEADIAREQRILEREKRYNEQLNLKYLSQGNQSTLGKAILNPQFVSPLTMKKTPLGTTVFQDIAGSSKEKPPILAKQTDASQLNALLETVYKRRALKAAGAVISTPNKGEKTKLGELPNVKFLVVTANYSDLDVLHHLVYMTDAVKSKVRKNILDFSGFYFNEDSSLYKDRMDFLSSLGYDISKRIAFLLGLCPFKTEIAQQDLNELIMYFLMSPCKTKQVPITHLPQNFFSKNMPEELCQLLQKHGDIDVSSVTDTPIADKVKSSTNVVSEKAYGSPKIPAKATPSSPKLIASKQKAKKSFKSSCLPPVQKMALSPSISTIPFNSIKPVQKSIGESLLMANNPSAASSLQKAILQTAPFNQSIPPPQEFLVQQQTPDGKQKTYKLIKLPANHPLTSVLKPQTQFPPTPPPIIQTQPVSFNSPLATLPPGIIIFKNKTDPPINITSAMPNVLQNVPVVLGQPQVNVTSTVVLPQDSMNAASSNKEEFVVPVASTSKLPVECDFSDDDIEELSPMKDIPPTDDELYSCIQEIIHNANFEDITLRNVIDRVAATYSDFDLTPRHMFMKECVKRIIIGS